MKKMLLVLTTIIAMLLVGCASTAEYALTIADIEPKLASIGGANIGFVDEDLEDGLVSYIQIDDEVYDSFFKSAAKLEGLVILSKVMATTATGQLKKFAMSKAADEAMQNNINDLVGNTSPEEWTTEQSFAVMKMAREQNKINTDELKYFATTAGSIGIAVVSLGKGVEEAKGLLPKGEELLKSVKSLKPKMILPALKGVKGSIENLNGVVRDTPKMLEEMSVLLSGFKALS